MKKIRVLHLVQSLRIGGMEQVVKALITNSEEQIMPIVGILRNPGYVATELDSKGYQVVYFGTNNSTLTLIKNIKQFLNNFHIDIIHCHDIGAWFVGTLAGRWQGNTIIIHTRHGALESEDNNFKTILQLKILSMLSHKIIAVSSEVKNNIIKNEHVSKDKIDVILNGIDLSAYQLDINQAEAKKLLGIDESEFLIGTVTRFHKIKNIEMQIDLIHALKDKIPNVKLIIAAPMDRFGYWKDIKNKIDKQGLEKYIILTGFRKDIPEILKALDIFVLTSFSEGTSIALLEAQAAGRPIIASAVGGNPYLIKHMKNGILFDVHRLDELINAVMTLYNAPDLRYRLSSAARDYVRKYSVEEMCQHYKGIYDLETRD